MIHDLPNLDPAETIESVPFAELRIRYGRAVRLLAGSARSDGVTARDLAARGRYRDAMAHLVRACEYAPDVTIASEQAVAFLNLAELHSPIANLDHRDAAWSAKFSPDGSRIFTASYDNTARVWDAFNGKAFANLAGLRTNALVSLGSALLILASLGIAMESDAALQANVMSRVMQGIITGIGFLGAGVILRDTGGTQVHGITMAATIWLTVTLGVLSDVGMWQVTLLGVGLTLLILVLGKPFEKFLHRKFPKLSDHHPDDVPPRT